MATETTFRTLFENDYTDYKTILENLIKPVFGEKVKERNQNLQVDTQDKDIISGIKIFADIGGAFPINFVDVTIKSKVKIRYNKVTVQRCVRKITDNLQSALIFFHYENVANRNWRITFVNKGESANDSTNPKRYTYLCGKNVSCRTCGDRFSVLKTEIANGNKILDELMKNAFSVETVSNEFFKEYKVFYEDFVQFITGNRYIKKNKGYEKEKIHDANKTIFPKFLKLANGIETDAQKLVRDYIKKMMGRLVFLQFLQKKHWLGVEQNDENWTSGDLNFIYNLFYKSSDEEQKDFLESVLEPLFFGMLNTDPLERRKCFKAESWNENLLSRFKKIPYLNGGLFAKDELDEIKIKFPKELFCNPQKAEVERVFSGKNNDYDYKAYCGLLDFFNRYNFTIDESDPSDVEVGVDPEMLGKIFENLLEDNKDKGAFYTPKEIVNYMCKESLIAYLIDNGESKIDNEKIRDFVNNPCAETVSIFPPEQLSILNHKLSTVKICDPAVGSGAFPMGLLNLLFACRHAINEKLHDDEKLSRAEIKKEIVKNNIYGVDIEKGAVDIARLRFWLSIVVDADKPEPLPNLDYKIMQGNSLIESYKGVDLSTLLISEEDNLFNSDAEVIQKLQNALNDYYMPKTPESKAALIKQINDIIRAILADKAYIAQNSEIEKELKNMKLSETSEFFLWHTWFSDVFNRPSESGGFDIVIGNPPYFVIKNESLNKKTYESNYSELKSGRMNIYQLFLGLGTRILTTNGIMTFIHPKTLLGDSYLSATRIFLQKRFNNIKIINIGDRRSVFEMVLQSVIISFWQKQRSESYTVCEINKKEDVKNIQSLALNRNDFILPDGKFFVNSNPIAYKIINKISRMKTENLNFSTGNYEWNKLKNNLSGKKKKNSIRLLFGENIQRYCFSESTIKRADVSFVNEKELSVLDKIVLMTQRTTAVEQQWRIIATLINPRDFDCGLATENHTNVASYDYKEKAKYHLALLNSKFLDFYIRLFNSNTQISSSELNSLPIPQATKKQQAEIVVLVDKILFTKKSNPTADTSELEKQIDELVYKLYGLTKEEIAVVEGM